MRLACLLAGLSLAAAAGAAELRATVRDAEGRPVRDAVVVAVPLAPQPGEAGARVEEVEQIDLEFVPGVKAIQVGTAVSFPNRDKVRHHVYSFSPAKRFELPLYLGRPAQPVRFDTPGVVTIGCNIHDWMVGHIYVADSPFFAKTAEDGEAFIGALPAGRYAVRVWHPRLAEAEEATRRETALGAAQSAAFYWRVALKPELRVRRAPAAGRSGQY
jgi:plastocyanin